MKYNLNKRSFIKLLGITFFSFFLMPFKFAKAFAKKVINENLTKKQKEIMFNEGTERPFTSDLLNEKREVFIIVQIVEFIMDMYLPMVLVKLEKDFVITGFV